MRSGSFGVDLTPSGAHVLTVMGLSPLVRNRESTFIDRIEELDEPIQLVDPEATSPVQDSSPYYRDTRLFLEALLRQSVSKPLARMPNGRPVASDDGEVVAPMRTTRSKPAQRLGTE